MLLSLIVMFGIISVVTAPGLIAQSLEERRAKRVHKESA